MYYRGSMRRGVSLEVILEEEDKSDAIKKCRPAKESSASSSSGDLEDTYEGGDEVDDESLERLRTEKKKRKRLKEEYKRKMQMRRSVSCETLTVLDIGKDDSSQEEWEEEAKSWSANNESNANNITRTISRRQILQSSKNFREKTSSSEDEMEIPETNASVDPLTERRVSVSRKDPYEEVELETSVDLSTEEDPEIEQCFSEDKSDFLSDGCRRFDEIQPTASLWLQSPISNQNDSWITVADLENVGAENIQKAQELEDVCRSVVSLVHTPASPDSTENISSENETEPPSSKEETSDEVRGDGEIQTHDEKLLTVKSARAVFDRPICIGSKAPILANSSQIFAMGSCHVLENPSVSVIEKTQKSHKILTDTRNHKETDIQGNKDTALIFNKHNRELLVNELPKKDTVLSVRQIFENLPRRGKKEGSQKKDYISYVRSNPTSRILRFDKEYHRKSPSILKEIPEKETLSRIISNYHGINTENHKSNHLKNQIAPEKCPTNISLRKPMLAKGFNIQKALMENPRHFHTRIEQIPEKSSHPNTKDILKFRDDRSDGDSWTSESSSDSGVSRDFSSSTIVSSFSRTSSKSPSPCWSEPENRTDPSFKWIDPKVLAKIRSVGTTFVYFGPKSSSNSSHVPGENAKSNTSSRFPSFDAITNSSARIKRNIQTDTENEPRVVGVLRKSPKNTITNEVDLSDTAEQARNIDFQMTDEIHGSTNWSLDQKYQVVENVI